MRTRLIAIAVLAFILGCRESASSPRTDHRNNEPGRVKVRAPGVNVDVQTKDRKNPNP